MTKMTISDTAKWLREHDDYLIITHRRPDGDTLGSAAALACALQAIGKSAYLLPNPDTTPRYAPFIERFLAPEGYHEEWIISADIATPSLFPTNIGEDWLIDLSVDHHASNTGYAARTLCDPTLAACGELVFELVSQLTEITAEMATLLYIAVVTDTGCFSFENTTANTFEVAAKLVQSGADSATLNRTFFRSKSRGRIAIEGTLLSNLQYFFDDSCAIVYISDAMVAAANATTDDLENLAAIPLAIEGVRFGALIRDLDDGERKVSLRSNGTVNVSDVSARFGGGGHRAAAGFTSTASAAELTAQLLAAVEDFL